MAEQTTGGQARPGFLRWALVLVPAVVIAGWLSGQAGGGPDDPWFDGLTKPAIYPPPVTFAVVWPILYLLMAAALAMVATARQAPGRRAAIAAFCIQLALNLGWSPLFFGAHRIAGALWLLVAIDLAVVVTIVLFWRVRAAAAMLLLPYLAWILFATVLNANFLALNPQADAVAAPD